MQNNPLIHKKCHPCKPGTPPLNEKAIQELRGLIDKSWQVDGNHHIERIYPFKTYLGGIDFINQVAKLAEVEQHHPLMIADYAKVTVRTWTHTVNGLSENDFILAAKTDALYAAKNAKA